MAFGIYVHIPYCLQRCSYCDFATYEQSQIIPPEKYIELLKQEIDFKSKFVSNTLLDTIYFGGGTPSLLPPELIVSVIDHLTRAGFRKNDNCEITVEINPATLTDHKMKTYLQAGVNRFSVGAQTFDDAILKFLKREHDSKDTRQTLSLLKSYGVNYSFDLLFAVPQQDLEKLKKDLAVVLEFQPNHISPYCLTVPKGHQLYSLQPSEDHQVEMFDLIKNTLLSAGYQRYEISNFCKPGFPSRHNSLYWEDENYWGIGLSSHSYFNEKPWGFRFNNPTTIGAYQDLIEAYPKIELNSILDGLPAGHFEKLNVSQSLSDFCHISLRRAQGLNSDRLQSKFGANVLSKLRPILAQQVELGLLQFLPNDSSWVLTEKGILLSNQVFGALTFLSGEIQELSPLA